MKKYSIIKTTGNVGFPTNFDGYLFNSVKYISLQQNKDFFYINLVDTSSQVCVARIAFFTKGMHGLSPNKAPFGSVEFSDLLLESDLKILINEIDKFSTGNNLSRFTIKSYPALYSAKTEMLHSLYIKNGYSIVNSEMNFHLSIGKDGYEDNLHLSEKRRLMKGEKGDFKFKLLDKPNASEVFNFIKTCRESRDYAMSIDKDSFISMVTALPNDYLIFTLSDRDKIIALTIGVRVNKNVLYNYLPCNDITYMMYSPMVMLLKGVYNYCRENNYKYFDLGPASGEDGLPAESLVRFKKNIGGIVSEKFTFEKAFSKK